MIEFPQENFVTTPAIQHMEAQKENVTPEQSNALQLYNPPTGNTTPDNNINFDILEFVANTDYDDQLLMAATQVESNSKPKDKVTTKSVIARKTSPKFTLQGTFSGCKIGNIGTINIHIHQS